MADKKKDKQASQPLIAGKARKGAPKSRVKQAKKERAAMAKAKERTEFAIRDRKLKKLMSAAGLVFDPKRGGFFPTQKKEKSGR